MAVCESPGRRDPYGLLYQAVRVPVVPSTRRGPGPGGRPPRRRTAHGARLPGRGVRSLARGVRPCAGWGGRLGPRGPRVQRACGWWNQRGGNGGVGDAGTVQGPATKAAIMGGAGGRGGNGGKAGHGGIPARTSPALPEPAGRAPERTRAPSRSPVPPLPTEVTEPMARPDGNSPACGRGGRGTGGSGAAPAVDGPFRHGWTSRCRACPPCHSAACGA